MIDCISVADAQRRLVMCCVKRGKARVQIFLSSGFFLKVIAELNSRHTTTRRTRQNYYALRSSLDVFIIF